MPFLTPPPPHGHNVQLHVVTLREKKSVLFSWRMQGAASNRCMAIATSPSTACSGNTLLQMHTARPERTLPGRHRVQEPPGSQGQPCSSTWPFILARHNYCHLHQQLRGIRTENGRWSFKPCFWEIFRLQEDAHVVA